MSMYFPGQVKQPRAGDGIDCERVRWTMKRTGDPVRQGVRGASATLNDLAALWEPRAGKQVAAGYQTKETDTRQSLLFHIQ